MKKVSTWKSTYQNAQADTGTASNRFQTALFPKDMDLICAIATPSAMSAYNSANGR